MQSLENVTKSNLLAHAPKVQWNPFIMATIGEQSIDHIIVEGWLQNTVHYHFVYIVTRINVCSATIKLQADPITSLALL